MKVLIAYNNVQDNPTLASDSSFAQKLVAFGPWDARIIGLSSPEQLEPSMLKNTWLVLIYSPNSDRTRGAEIVDKALDLSVKREMQGVLAVTTGGDYDLPERWKTIHKFDASSQEENRALDSVCNFLNFARSPYVAPREQWPWRGSKNSNNPTSLQSSTGHAQPSRKKKFDRQTITFLVGSGLFLVIALLLFAAYIYQNNHPGSTLSSTNLTATAQALDKQKTPVASPTPTTSFWNQQYSAVVKDPRSNNSLKLAPFDPVTQKDNCQPSAPNSNTYKVTQAQANRYSPCLSQQKDEMSTDFAYQVNMRLVNGDAEGVVFGVDDPYTTYYRLSLVSPAPITVDSTATAAAASGAPAVSVSPSPSPTASTASGNATALVTYCHSSCNSPYALDGDPLYNGQVSITSEDLQKGVTITVIVKGNSFGLFVSDKLLFQYTSHDQPSIRGKVGVYAASVHNQTEVDYSALKVWQLASNEKKQPPSPSKTPVATPTP